MKICLSFLVLLMSCFSLHAQIFLNLEFPNKAETIKYRAGHVIHFKHASFPDSWRKEKIVTIVPDKSLLVLENDILHLDQIIAIRQYNPWANYLSKSLYIFSSQWVIIGGIATLFLDYDPSIKDLIIPVATAGIAWIVQKLFYKTNFKIGKNCRLRIIDLRMSIE